MLIDPTMDEKKFDEIVAQCKNRLNLSYYKYGPARDNNMGRVDVIETIDMCINKYKKTHNTEYLCDVINYAAMRIMFPWPGDFFKATDSGESAGVAGTPINMER